MRRCCRAITCPSAVNSRNPKSTVTAAAKSTRTIHSAAVLFPGSSRNCHASSPAKTSRRPGELNIDRRKLRSQIQMAAKASCRWLSLVFQLVRRITWCSKKTVTRTTLATTGRTGQAPPAGCAAKRARRTTSPHAAATASPPRSLSKEELSQAASSFAGTTMGVLTVPSFKFCSGIFGTRPALLVSEFSDTGTGDMTTPSL
mmetsp:Transcript_70074/g.167397  ORF Transcript_70074/g.167397 Transcript_70074/m.167397 type:complete len:201 (+) Transcript_70074:1840-2442(+)